MNCYFCRNVWCNGGCNDAAVGCGDCGAHYNRCECPSDEDAASSCTCREYTSFPECAASSIPCSPVDNGCRQCSVCVCRR